MQGCFYIIFIDFLGINPEDHCWMATKLSQLRNNLKDMSIVSGRVDILFKERFDSLLQFLINVELNFRKFWPDDEFLFAFECDYGFSFI